MWLSNGVSVCSFGFDLLGGLAVLEVRRVHCVFWVGGVGEEKFGPLSVKIGLLGVGLKSI